MVLFCSWTVYVFACILCTKTWPCKVSNRANMQVLRICWIGWFGFVYFLACMFVCMHVSKVSGRECDHFHKLHALIRGTLQSVVRRSKIINWEKQKNKTNKHTQTNIKRNKRKRTQPNTHKQSKERTKQTNTQTGMLPQIICPDTCSGNKGSMALAAVTAAQLLLKGW